MLNTNNTGAFPVYYDMDGEVRPAAEHGPLY